MKKDLLVTLADKNYVEQAKQLFSSVYWNAGWKGDYMLLVHGIDEKKLKWFRKKRILVRKYKLLYNKRIGSRKHPPILLSKFYLFTPEFKKWKKIICLDADIIVRASLDKLTKINGLAATNFNPLKLSKYFKNYKRIDKELFRELLAEVKKKYDLKKKSFNSGVMVFSSNIIKKETFGELRNLFMRYKDIVITADEMPLNLYFQNKYTKLPIIYNVYTTTALHCLLLEYEEIKGVILHFMNEKPWNPKNPFYKEWKNNLERAELIDLKKIQNAKIWTKKEIKKYSRILKRRKFFYAPIREFNRFLGKIGIFLKRNFPKLYWKLKKFKK